MDTVNLSFALMNLETWNSVTGLDLRFCALSSVYSGLTASSAFLHLPLWNTKDRHRLSLQQYRDRTWAVTSQTPFIHPRPKSNFLLDFAFCLIKHLPHSLPWSRDEGWGWTCCRGNGLLSRRWADEQKTWRKKRLRAEQLSNFECFWRPLSICGVAAESEMSGTKPREFHFGLMAELR